MMTFPNSNAPGQGGEAAKQATEQRQYSRKSTATEAQHARIIDALRISPRTSYDLRRMGVYQVSARIFELRQRGFRIETELINLWDEEGFLHPRSARYHLRGEPLEGLQ